MNKFYFNKATSGLIAAFLLISITSVTGQVYAQAPPGMPTMITGTYSNSDYGVQMAFPDGWQAMETKSTKGTSVAAFPQDQGSNNGGSPSASVISLSMMPKSTTTTTYTDPNIPADPKVKCDVISSDKTNLNGMSAVVTVTQCTSPDGDIKMKGYSFQTDKNVIYANYMAMPASLYDSNVASFDSAINTLQIANTVDAPSAPPVSSPANENPASSSPTTTQNPTSSSAVPEFPIQIIIVFAVVMGMAAILGKTKLSSLSIK